MFIKITVYTQDNIVAFYDTPKNWGIWHAYCRREMGVRLIQGFTICLDEG